MSHAVEARRLLRSCRSGALATLSRRLQGYPFVTAAPFMSDFDGSVVLLISRLAEHTKNIEADTRVSLLVHESSSDVQAAARLTVAGMCDRIDAQPELKERYVRRFPDANDLLALDFDFHRIQPTAIRYIGGFGKIHWIEPASFISDAGIGASIEQAQLAFLNDRRSQDLLRAGASDSRLPSNVRAIALDCDGVDVRVGNEIHTQRLAFVRSVTTGDDLTAAFDTLLGREAS